MDEFGGDAVVYFNPEDPNDIASKIKSIIDNEECMSMLSNKALQRAKLYNWEIYADKTWKALTEI